MHDDDKLYKDIIHSQAEMSMKYVGQKLADDEFSKLDNESSDFEIPEHLQNKLNELIRCEELNKKKRRFYSSLNRFTKVCSIFVVAIIIIGVFSYKNVSAFKYKFDNFISKFKEDYIELEPNSSDITPAKKSNVWLPSYIPNDYKLSYIDINKDFQETVICFEDNKNNVIYMTYTPADSTKIHLDNEAEQSGEFTLNDEYLAFWSLNDKSVDICWLQSDNIFILRGHLDLEEMKRIAESIYYNYD